ncbi:uncharacterized protein LOC135105903 isoform X3 [Scylla paramamosain]|uniref:uncharacterized protein LOC135105903 isoform X3 n=1 Tax=Scylla paramamosain TaxID=85552 RepID=UPI0030835AC2
MTTRTRGSTTAQLPLLLTTFNLCTLDNTLWRRDARLRRRRASEMKTEFLSLPACCIRMDEKKMDTVLPTSVSVPTRPSQRGRQGGMQGTRHFPGRSGEQGVCGSHVGREAETRAVRLPPPSAGARLSQLPAPNWRGVRKGEST